jgi:hypothetical protein
VLLFTRFSKLTADTLENGIRAYAFLAQFLIRAELIRIKVIGNLLDFDLG